MKDLLFFDIEVFFRNSFVVFKNAEGETLRVFHNDFHGLQEFINGKTLVGFNNYWYDDHILHAMLDYRSPAQIKSLSDRIIHGEQMKIKHYKFDSLDVFQQLDPSMPSLKKIESNLGKKILESSVSFEIERELTDDEFLDVLNYCEYDVSITILIYKMREKNYFEPKQSLLDMLGNPFAKRWNTTTISANVLTSKPIIKWSEIRVPDEIMDLVPSDVAELWRTQDKGKIIVNEFDNEIVFSFGGLHAQNTKKKHFKNVINLDVASLYPSLIVNHRVLGNGATETYKGILEERIRIKHTDPYRQAGLKLLLNSVFGLLKSEYSLLYNKRASTTVCAIGQAILYDLAKRLSTTAEIVQINTDGVAFIPFTDDYKEIWKEWEKDHNLTLEREDFVDFWQRDVNNYIAITPDGKVKTKGGDVSRYSEDAVFKSNNTRIIDICIVEKLTKGRDVLDVLLENIHNPKLFQYTLQAGRTFKGTYDSNGKKMDRINRVFASKTGDYCLYKRRHDGCNVRYPDAPSRMFVWNDECDKLENFAEIVDLNHYYQIINKKLERWI